MTSSLLYDIIKLVWEKFNKILSNNTYLHLNTVLDTTGDINSKVESVNTALQQAFNQAYPITYISSAIFG